jgi:DNA mismatch repair protein MutL
VEGTQIIVNGGKIVEVKAAGSAPGTSVEVRQLFFNLPARRKFLRTEETEAAHIQHYLTLAALAFPEVAFTFQKDGRLLWQLPAVKSGNDATERLAALRERFRALIGDVKLLAVDFSRALTEADMPEESPSFETAQPAAGSPSTPNPHPPTLRVWGLMGAPGVSRATREDQHIFVNRRPVENRGINFALLEGYHTALMKGRYPVGCLFLEMDPAAVDVNIHPAKREVKFHREAEVRRFVAQAVRETLLAYHGSQSGVRSPESRGQARPSAGQHRPPVITIPGHEKAPAPVELPNFTPPLPQRPAMFPAKPEQRPLKMGFASTTHTPPAEDHASRLPPHEPPTPTPTHPPTRSPAPLTPVPLLNVPLRLVGVIGKLYVVLESDRGLVLLDQHAAHERILFEQMLERLERNAEAPSQKLLLPESIELSPRDAQFLREQLPALTRLGVGLGEFGERTFLLDALPPFVKVSDSRRFVLDLVDELKAAGREVNTVRLGEHTVAKTVCRHAVKANDPLAGRELENLVEDLRRCTMPYTCPHGRPTLIEMNYRELEKKFGRTQ